MSMATLTMFQLAGIFCAYLLVTVALPAFALGEKLRGRRMPERFMFYFITGNFYVMNLVFALQLLKLSHPVTMILGTVIPTLLVRAYITPVPVWQFMKNLTIQLRRLIGGQLGVRTALHKTGDFFFKQLARLGRWLRYLLINRAVDCILTAVLLAALWWVYGRNLIDAFGFKASDVVVHNNWVNSLSNNVIFVEGVYPYGFHCLTYYFHAVFGIETYVFLRLFAFVTNVMIHLMLLCLLRLCCKSKYIAYAGVILFVISDCLYIDTYSRFYVTLPQEFGIIFVLPCVYYGFAYFETRQRELKEDTPDHSVSRLHLAGFCMSFSMTLAVHFYNTLIVGLFCAAIAVGYGFLFFRKAYFWQVVQTVVLSVGIALAPMAIAYVSGTPLQGSMFWGMNIITKGDTEAIIEDATAEREQAPALQDQKENKQGSVERIITSGKKAWQQVYRVMSRRVFVFENELITNVIMLLLLLLIPLGAVHFLLRQRCYGAMLISTGLFMLIMSAILVPSAFHIPSLLERQRASEYLSYSLPVALTMLADGLLCLPLLALRGKRAKVGRTVMNLLSLVCVVVAVGWTVTADALRAPSETDNQEMNEAVVCLTNIIETEKDFSWTIVSANDELRMGWDHGYHYETVTFLRAIEGADPKARLYIPTETVFFFIEKIPISYNIDYDDIGQAVSPKGASRAIPNTNGIYVYGGEDRWILMSRMYYWAQEFRKLYPNEMEVYLETDAFVCYRLKQNLFRLFNLAINYGYNAPRGQ